MTYANSLVPFPIGMFAFGSVGIVLRRLPGLATDAVVAFFAAVTPATHDFWNASGREKQHESNHFIKNGATLGAELAVLLRASRK